MEREDEVAWAWAGGMPKRKPASTLVKAKLEKAFVITVSS